MARLNTRPSVTASIASRQVSATPDPAFDQENRAPDATSRRDKGKGPAVGNSTRRNLPTPSSEEVAAGGQKRKRGQERTAQVADDMSDMDEDEARYTRYFDPNQDIDKRRQVKRKSRALMREFNENRNELLHGDGTGLKDTINRANNVFKGIKQTNDATVDSRLFVDVSNMALKRSTNLVQGDRVSGVDVDELLRKAITYMRNGGPLNEEQHINTSTQTQRRRNRGDDDDDDEEDGHLDWETFGEVACFPYNSRPACPSFLLGPLSVEKKQRKQTQRSARQTKDTNSREMRPEALSRADLNQSDENTLTAMCTRIREHLIQHCEREVQAMRARFGGGRRHEIATPEGKAWLKKHHITRHRGPYLFDYVINPNSFGQTVENLFYVSFLIKEGAAAITPDDSGLPVINPSQATDVEQKRAMKSTKHQAVFSLDYKTWQQLVEAFDIQESMIPHRSEEQASQVGQRGWYT